MTTRVDLGEPTGMGGKDDAEVAAALKGADTSALDAAADREYDAYLDRLAKEMEAADRKGKSFDSLREESPELFD